LPLEHADPVVNRDRPLPAGLVDRLASLNDVRHREQIANLLVAQQHQPWRQELSTRFADLRILETARERSRHVADALPRILPDAGAVPVLELHLAAIELGGLAERAAE